MCLTITSHLFRLGLYRRAWLTVALLGACAPEPNLPCVPSLADGDTLRIKVGVPNYSDSSEYRWGPCAGRGPLLPGNELSFVVEKTGSPSIGQCYPRGLKLQEGFGKWSVVTVDSTPSEQFGGSATLKSVDCIGTWVFRFDRYIDDTIRHGEAGFAATMAFEFESTCGPSKTRLRCSDEFNVKVLSP